MTEGKPYLPGSGMDDRIVVEEMLRDPQSEHWYECYLSVQRLVQLQAKNIPQDHWNDITQDAMMRVHRYMPVFQGKCSFGTWLFGIVRSCIIDHYRKFARAGQHTSSHNDPNDHLEREDEVFTTNATQTVEEAFIARDELHQALTALQEYVSIHANQARNRRILDMVLFEGRSLEETAKAVGCSAPVVGYVVRSAQRYVRVTLGRQP